MAAHCGGAAPLDGYEYSEMQPGEPSGWPVHESVASGGYDIGQLEEWPLHSLLAGTVFRVRGRREGERVERACGSFEMPLRQMQVATGRLQIGVAQQKLNGTQVSAGFEQVRSEAMPKGMRVDAFIQSRARRRLLHGVPYALGCHGDITLGMSAFAGKQISLWFGVCRAPVVAKFL